MCKFLSGWRHVLCVKEKLIANLFLRRCFIHSDGSKEPQKMVGFNFLKKYVFILKETICHSAFFFHHQKVFTYKNPLKFNVRNNEGHTVRVRLCFSNSLRKVCVDGESLPLSLDWCCLDSN